MYKQVGSPEIDEKGIIKKGIIIRHLVLPNHIENTKKILKWIKTNFGNEVYISIMAQYFPTYKAMQSDLNRKLTKEERKENRKKNRKMFVKYRLFYISALQ